MVTLTENDLILNKCQTLPFYWDRKQASEILTSNWKISLPSKQIFSRDDENDFSRADISPSISYPITLKLRDTIMKYLSFVWFGKSGISYCLKLVNCKKPQKISK